ncbi:MAG: hypothetical protein CMP59_10180 [Flavobacteriales bacterium]|nr:hypothetical protein [Flavobacteriales bacterium]
MKNTQINRAVTKKIAKALGALNNKVVYVGGAVVSLYINDPSAEDVRPTKDLDLTLQIASLSELEALREELVSRGFVQSAQDKVVCRFRYDDVLVDVMATEAIGWAPGNRWFASSFHLAIEYPLDDITIKLLPLPYFLATKFDAFFDRGIKDVWNSHDYEDIIYLLNYHTELVKLIADAEKTVKEYLKECAVRILKNERLQEAIIGNLYHEAQEERYYLIINKLKEISVEL